MHAGHLVYEKIERTSLKIRDEGKEDMTTPTQQIKSVNNFTVSRGKRKDILDLISTTTDEAILALAPVINILAFNLRTLDL